MVLDDIFGRSAQQRPVTVMVRAALEHTPSARAIDAPSERAAQRRYARTLLFSSVADLMGSVVARTRPAVDAACRAEADPLGVPLRAVHDEPERAEPGPSAELVRHTARTPAPVVTAMGGRRAAWLPGYHAKILDGNHPAGTGHRLEELRTVGAGAWPGHALVVLDPRAMPVTDAFPCEDGHARERSLLGSARETARARDVGIADRNSCTTDFLFGIDRRGGHLVIRQHAAALRTERMGGRRSCGRPETGAVFGQEMRLGDGEGETMAARRIAVESGPPTRDGETEAPILTNLPAEAADALAVASLYRRRWTAEAGFGELATCRNGEANAPGHPEAALFAFGVALVPHDVMSVAKAALRSAQGEEAVEELSLYDPAGEVAGTHRGMMVAIPEGEWAVFHGLTAAALGGIRLDPAAGARLPSCREQERGPKRPRPKRESGAKIKHVSTARLLGKRKEST